MSPGGRCISKPRCRWMVLAGAGRCWASARPAPNLVLAQQAPLLDQCRPAPCQHLASTIQCIAREVAGD
jgi:hypothetical protein